VRWIEEVASPPAGGGGAPRQGWLDAADGVFFRLAIGTFTYKHGTSGNGDVYSVQELRSWLDQTGWRFLEQKPLGGPASLVVAEAV